MNSKLSTVLTASMIAMLAAGIPATAEAKAKPQPQGANTQALQKQVEALQAQLNALQSRLDQQAAAQTQTDQKAQDAQAQAAAAAQQAQAAQTQVADASAKADKASKDSGALAKAVDWAKDTKISGRMYFNASHVTHEVNGIKSGNSDNGGGFNIKRFYVGIDHKFSDMFSGNITTDVSSISGVGQTLYIKKAYLQAKLNPAFVVRLGATDMPWIPYAEGIYGYRHIEQTVSDRTKFGTSSDWGVHVSGDLAGGLISYQVSAVDGAGYRNPQFGRTIDFEGRVSAQYKGFNVAVGGYTGKLGQDKVSSPPSVSSALRTYNRLNALVAYKGNINKMPFTIGGEYFYAENKKFNSTAPVAAGSSDKADGYSAFASVGFMPKWSLFGRYDSVKPNEVTSYGLKDDYYNVGIQWSPAKIVDLAIVYKREEARGGAFSTGSLQSGVIGCSVSATQSCTGKGTYDEIGLFGQFRF